MKVGRNRRGWRCRQALVLRQLSTAPNLRQIAYHEAGHAVIAVLFDVPSVSERQRRYSILS
jgi:hypothetical protein